MNPLYVKATIAGAVLGAMLGASWAIPAAVDLWRSTAGPIIFRWAGTALVLLAVPAGALFGAVCAAFLNGMIWCIVQVINIHDPKARSRLGLVCLASLIGIAILFILSQP